jgi:hypothetical protein
VTGRAAARGGQAWNIGPSHFLDNIRLAAPESSALLDESLAGSPNPPAPAADAASALDWLRAKGEGSPLWVSPSLLLPYGTLGPVWTGMNDIGAYAPLPPDEVERFIRNSAQDLHRPGWILIDRSQSSPWPAFYFAAYSVTEQRDFGGYTAYRLAPK